MTAVRRSLERALFVTALSPLLLVAVHEFRVAALLVAAGMFFAAFVDQLQS
jgi:hypothetical protein